MTASPPAAPGMPGEEIARILRSVAKAYPEDAFPEVTPEERAKLKAQAPGLQDRIAASMGRFLAKHFLRAADEIEAMEARALSAEAKLAQAVEALEPFAWPPLYVFDRDQAFVPTKRPDDWEGGG